MKTVVEAVRLFKRNPGLFSPGICRIARHELSNRNHLVLEVLLRLVGGKRIATNAARHPSCASKSLCFFEAHFIPFLSISLLKFGLRTLRFSLPGQAGVWQDAMKSTESFEVSRWMIEG